MNELKKFIKKSLLFLVTVNESSKIFKGTLFIICIFFISFHCHAAIRRVPLDYTTIQQAINDADSGDVVYVAPGTYNEYLNIKDGVSLIASGPGITTIDGGTPTHEVIKCVNIDSGTLISGFTITNGSKGISCYNSNPVIRNNYITNINTSSTRGDGILLDNSSPRVENNVIFKVGGMGITAYNNSESQIINNTIVDYRYYAGISFASLNIGSVSPIIKNNIIWRNNTSLVCGILWSEPATPDISYNNVFDPFNGSGTGGYFAYHNTQWHEHSGGSGALKDNPLFQDASAGDFHLLSDSPCKDAGDPNEIYNDIDGSRNDMGAYGGPLWNQADIDGDGVLNDLDNCLMVFNPDQEDIDNDCSGDACDVCPNDPNNDLDEDNICGDLDNCQNTYNPDQSDIDDDGIGDICDGCPEDSAKNEPGVCGCGMPDIDNDGDEIFICNDCDDSDAERYPGNTEICDGKDNNCDGKVDVEGSQGCTIYYKDEDNDGQGVDEDSQCLCSPDDPNKYTAIYSGDPDDLDPNIQGTILTGNMNLPNGWSMISVRLDPDNASLSSLFSDAVVVYSYEKGAGYIRVKEGENLEKGRGYWILLNEAKTYSITGEIIDKYNLSVQDGWYMIGGCTSDAMASFENCSIKVNYGYEQGSGYIRIQEGEHLKPGKGYWILFKDVVDQCELTVEVIDPNI